jgi:DNA polymerase bacteriophage-type
MNHVMSAHRVNAWNAGFEWAVWNYTLMRQLGAERDICGLSITQLHDTMAAAAYWGLPLKLDDAAPAAGLSVVKDKDGHALMLRMSRPRSYSPATGVATWWHEDEPARLDRLCEYCQQDVRTERAILGAIPPLPPAEREIWLLDHRINQRGVAIDFALVDRLQALADEAGRRGGEALARLTGGAIKSVSTTTALTAWLRAHTPYPANDVQRATIEARLADPGCTGVEREVLAVRFDTGRTSTSKLAAMTDACPERRGDHGTAYGLLQHYGANRTGRWAGRIIQPQNMPRGSIWDTEGAIALILARACYDTLEWLHGSVMAVVSSCLRGCIVAPPGWELVVADFSQIEARVLPWLAGDQTTLDVFRAGGDVYVIAAAGIFRKTPEAVTGGERQIGKVAVLALGFGGGVGAFQTMAANYGLRLSDAEADAIKVAWRAANPQIVGFWRELENAARTVILAGTSRIVGVGPLGQPPHLLVGMYGPHMVIRLPSGRALVYRDARIEEDGSISYMGVDQYTRKWTRIRTYGGKLAENVTQAVARCAMAAAMLAADRRGIGIVLTVHDEVIARERAPLARQALDNLLRIMRTPPAWAPDLPVNAEGWHGPRYRK